MTGIVQLSPLPQEISSLEAHMPDEDRKRKSQEHELPVAKKVKQVFINSQAEEINYTPEFSQDPMKPILPTSAQARPSCMMPMHPTGDIQFPEFWTSTGRTVVPLGEELWIGKQGRHGQELKLALCSRIGNEHFRLSWDEGKSRIIVQAKDYPRTTLGVCVTGGKWVGKEKINIRVGHLATIRLDKIRIQFLVPQPSENEVTIHSFTVDKGVMLGDTLQTLFNQFNRSLFLGRKPIDNNIILGHGTVSRRHGQLQLLEDGSVRVTNLSHHNQLNINGKRLDTNHSAIVPAGKHLNLEIGQVKFFIEVPNLQAVEEASALGQDQNTIPNDVTD